MNLVEHRSKGNSHQESIASNDESETIIKGKIIEKNDNITTFNRIIAKNVREYHFITPYDSIIELGQIFSINDSVKKIVFLARVTDIEHDSNYDGNWDTTLKGTEFYDDDQIFNKIITEPLGCLVYNDEKGKNIFKQSKTIPTKFSSVKQSDKTELAFLSEVMGDIEVGYLRNGSQKVQDIPVSLHSKIMDHHMGVFATTGMGKSNFMKVFAASCIKKAAQGESKFGLLLIDPHGEYILGNRRNRTAGLLELKKYRKGFKCYSTDTERAKRTDVEELRIGFADVNPMDLIALYGGNMSMPQREALGKIERSIKKGLYTEKNWLERIKDGEKLTTEHFKGDTLEVITRRAEDILDFDYMAQDRHDRSSINGIIANLQEGNVVLIDLPQISEWSELFLLSVLSRHILDQYKKEGFSAEKKSCLITIEEAQRVLGGGEGSTSRFETIAREGRKFGVGLCAITQQPKLIDKQLLSQFNTFVILGLGDRNDRKCLEESAKQDLTTLDVEIQTLEKGEAIISTLKVPFPIPVTIHLYEDYIKQLKEQDKDLNRSSRGKKLVRPPN